MELTAFLGRPRTGQQVSGQVRFRFRASYCSLRLSLLSFFTFSGWERSMRYHGAGLQPKGVGLDLGCKHLLCIELRLGP